MYNRDCKKIAKFAMKNPDNFFWLIVFVLCTIQASLQSTVPQIQDIKKNGRRAKFFNWEMKRIGHDYAYDNRHNLFLTVKACVKANDAVGAIDALTSVNGLGIVKAAFVVQMCGLDVACLDSHNLSRLGLSQSHFKLSKTVSHATKRKKIAEYVEYTRKTGGSQYWWDSWCAYVAGNRANKALDTAQKVSKYHVTAVMQMA